MLAYKAWRLDFQVEGQCIRVTAVQSGYRPSELFRSDAEDLAVHREFVERFH